MLYRPHHDRHRIYQCKFYFTFKINFRISSCYTFNKRTQPFRTFGDSRIQIFVNVIANKFEKNKKK